MPDVAGRRDHEVPGDVVPPVEAVDRAACGGLDRVDRAEDRAAERVIGPQRLGEEVVHEVLGRVLVHVDLLEDHLPLGVEVRRTDHRVLQHVREVIDRQLQVAVEHARVVARVLLGGERVQVAADGVERLARCPARSGSSFP